MECVNFYGSILGLRVMFDTDVLICFEFGSSYLMVEIDDEYQGEPTPPKRPRTCLRWNVNDVKQIADTLTSKGISVNFQEYSWGTIAKFHDSDGNLCALKDSPTFEEQISDYIVT